ncbi:hypothetical protein HanIR_Chr13g0654761 [Helianthus annuus]|nr:hypothetical protein HanIR_Chr13g0654761 [Helianthus annuus]
MCVCVSDRMLSKKLSIFLCASISQVSQVLLTHTLHGYIYTQPNMSGPKDLIDGPKDHLSNT